ncbi:hypothetical protein [Massilia cavernae]|uniref:hypothetical protein n=1 Tax=Massilia cavernae TaxID=2320864 RepID=UPI0011C3E955|nr:hypothetical protein [Massilia cavernae]
MSDDDAIVITDYPQIETFFAQAAQWYHSQGVASTRPDIERSEALSDGVFSVDVRWPGFDEAGVEKLSERSRYIVRRDAGGRPRIQVAMARTR